MKLYEVFVLILTGLTLFSGPFVLARKFLFIYVVNQINPLVFFIFAEMGVFSAIFSGELEVVMAVKLETTSVACKSL